MSYNKVILVGNVGKHPEVRTTQTGKRVASLSLATSEKWKNQAGEKQESTEWHKVVVFGDGLVNVIESYVNKGDKLLIEGKIKTRDYEKNGAKHYITEIVVSGMDGKLSMLGGGKQQQGGGQPKYNAPQQHSPSEVYSPQPAFDDDIPF